MDIFRNSEKIKINVNREIEKCPKIAHFYCIEKRGRKLTDLEIQKSVQKLHIFII